MTFFKLFLAFTISLLTACGGGGSAPDQVKRSCLYVSASDGTGFYVEDGVLRQYLPDPVDMLNDVARVHCVNRSVNGITLAGLLESGLLAKHLQADKPQVVVIGAGANDALFFGISLDTYRTNMRRAVDMVRQNGATPYFRGFNRMVIAGVVTTERLARRDEFNAAAKSEARLMGVTFIDLDGVEFHGLDDLSPDMLHAKPSYNRRIAEHIGRHLD